jgi:hypothetical protein
MITSIVVVVVAVIVVIVVIILFTFLKDLNSSKKDFKGKPMKEVFSNLIEYFNRGVFGGNVKIIENNQLYITLIHNVSSQHRVVMQYMNGDLVIDWSWKYLHQELNHSKTIQDVLNVNEDKMREIAKELAKVMAGKMEKHAEIINKMI